jgi:hypothetical protein
MLELKLPPMRVDVSIFNMFATFLVEINAPDPTDISKVVSGKIYHAGFSKIKKYSPIMVKTIVLSHLDVFFSTPPSIL